MRYLQSLFQSQLNIILGEDGTALIGDTPFSALAILETDPIAYANEYQSWLANQWLPERLSLLERLMRLDGNAGRYRDLKTLVEQSQVIPFVGSGMSVPSGLKTWSDFLRSLRNRSTLPRQELESLLKEGKYETAADRVSGSMPGRLFEERIDQELRVRDHTEIFGAVWLLPHLFSGIVCTTNLDNILELVYEDQGSRFQTRLAGRDVRKFRQLRAGGGSFLLKLHGDCQDQDGRVLLTSEYEAAYAETGETYRELDQLFRSRSLLVTTHVRAMSGLG